MLLQGVAEVGEVGPWEDVGDEVAGGEEPKLVPQHRLPRQRDQLRSERPYQSFEIMHCLRSPSVEMITFQRSRGSHLANVWAF
jgi:hypothetical protein